MASHLLRCKFLRANIPLIFTAGFRWAGSCNMWGSYQNIYAKHVHKTKFN